MSLFLNVPYAEKDIAKFLGAKWNPTIKKWYVTDRTKYHKFNKWILNGEEFAYIICNYFYIIVGTRKCFKCKKQTQVVAFGVEKYFEVFDENIYDDDSSFAYVDAEISISPIPDKLPANFLKYLKSNFHLYKDYSFQAGESYLVNHCQHCNAIQGNFYLFDEVDSPFFIDSIDNAKN